ncbi:unnamed protein product [Oppiella nova]|uniref:Uncharacterized protein n=1 Tax=Oppiella nova TaxID=334625 RepID=A0A7R9MDS6_9ACAR|nr:unnamed protein product [Oppiella nova]CAG2175371.1 unnamed protein product [Oppiella nova]
MSVTMIEPALDADRHAENVRKRMEVLSVRFRGAAGGSDAESDEGGANSEREFGVTRICEMQREMIELKQKIADDSQQWQREKQKSMDTERALEAKVASLAAYLKRFEGEAFWVTMELDLWKEEVFDSDRLVDELKAEIGRQSLELKDSAQVTERLRRELEATKEEVNGVKGLLQESCALAMRLSMSNEALVTKNHQLEQMTIHSYEAVERYTTQLLGTLFNSIAH